MTKHDIELKQVLVKTGSLALALARTVKQLHTLATSKEGEGKATVVIRKFIGECASYLEQRNRFDVLTNLFAKVSSSPVFQASIGTGSAVEWIFKYSLILHSQVTPAINDLGNAWVHMLRPILSAEPLGKGKIGLALNSYCTVNGSPFAFSAKIINLKWFDRLINEIKLEKRRIVPSIFPSQNKPQQVDVDRKVKAFISYSHLDQQDKANLFDHLKPLATQGLLDPWADSSMNPGQKINREITERIENTKLFLALISRNYLASSYCMDVEMKQALSQIERGKTDVIPIILKPCDWKYYPFGELKALPTDGKPVNDRTTWPSKDHAFTAIAHDLRKIIEQILQIA